MRKLIQDTAIYYGIKPFRIPPKNNFNSPVTCFFEQSNLVNIFCGLKLPAIEDALDALSAMPLSVSDIWGISFIYTSIKQPLEEVDLFEAANEAGLAEHNRLRALHKDTPSMVQGLKITVDAQNWAKKLVNEWKGPGSDMADVLVHARFGERIGQGENLAYIGAKKLSPAEACVKAVQCWYKEIKDYDYANPGYQPGAGHFTQVS